MSDIFKKNVSFGKCKRACQTLHCLDPLHACGKRAPTWPGCGGCCFLEIEDNWHEIPGIQRCKRIVPVTVTMALMVPICTRDLVVITDFPLFLIFLSFWMLC
jgi:hypothetical protein